MYLLVSYTHEIFHPIFLVPLSKYNLTRTTLHQLHCHGPTASSLWTFALILSVRDNPHRSSTWHTSVCSGVTLSRILPMTLIVTFHDSSWHLCFILLHDIYHHPLIFFSACLLYISSKIVMNDEYLYFLKFIFERERERERAGRDREREGQRIPSRLCTESREPMWGWNSRTIRSWPEPKSDT